MKKWRAPPVANAFVKLMNYAVTVPKTIIYIYIYTYDIYTFINLLYCNISYIKQLFIRKHILFTGRFTNQLCYLWIPLFVLLVLGGIHSSSMCSWASLDQFDSDDVESMGLQKMSATTIKIMKII